MYSKLDPRKKNSQNQLVGTGSCVKLVDYLTKENSTEKCFFSHTLDSVPSHVVMETIDNNRKTLKVNQEKYYELSYNPSSSEIQHLIKVSIGKDVQDLSLLSLKERKIVFDNFREYVRECMNVYASKFNREKILSGKDLVYFGKIEEFRYYTYEDNEVKLGLAKKGDKKPGLNLHAHIIVSRMDATQTIALSPRNNCRGGMTQLNGKEIKNGFNMKEWQKDCFLHFAKKYKYNYNRKEAFFDNHLAYSSISKQIQNMFIMQIMRNCGLEEERKVLKSVRKISIISHTPKHILTSSINKKIKEILSDNEPVI